jgi:hypothetical protein
MKQLAEQAWSADCLEENPQWKKSDITDLLLQDMATFHQKFAELIVKECVQMFANDGYDESVDMLIEHWDIDPRKFRS